MWREGEGKPLGRQNHCFCRNFGRVTAMASGDYRLRTEPTLDQDAAASGLSGADTSTGRGGATLRWLLRSNNIRRSKALERMIGKRAKIFSRTFRKSDAISTTFFVSQPGNARGPAIVSDRKTRR